MTNHVGVTIPGATQDRPVNVIEADGLTARFSTGCTPTGEWFALGTIVRDDQERAMPAWVVVGTGTSPDEAIVDLTVEISRQARTAPRA